MRKTSNVQKTENKQIKKTISKAFAIVVSLVLISFTVSAQGFWKQILVNNTYGKMAELMVEQKNADDQLLKTTAHFSKRNELRPVITTENTSQMTFETYFGSQWIADRKTLQAHSPMLGRRSEDSILNNQE
jgi:hypothetical protein